MMSFLPQRKFDINDGIVGSYFQVERCRLTVALLLHDNSSIYMVEPKGAPVGREKLIFPQEKLKFVHDPTFKQCALRGLNEELGLRERELAFYPQELCRFENHLPVDRTGEPTTKTIVVFAVRVRSKPTRLNPTEIRSIKRVLPQEFLDSVYGCNRPQKCVAYAEALKAAFDAGQLSDTWESTVELLFSSDWTESSAH